MPFALPTRHDPAPSHDRLLRLTSPPAPHVDGDSLREHSGIDVGQWVPLTGAAESDSPPPHDEGQGGSLLARLRSRVPASLRGRRLDPGVRGVSGLAVLAAVAALVAVVLAWRSAPRPASVALPRPVVDATGAPVAGAAAGGAAAGVRPSAAAQVVVEVAGKVARPGVVRLPAGSRVGDAVHAAGGLSPGSSTIGLSMARRLVDGEQILVGAPAPTAAGAAPASATPSSSSGGAAAASADAPLDLNAATAAQLDALPGVGPVLAQRIVAWREQHGGFTSPDQLRQVSGLGGKKGEALMPLVRV